jgi:hypothetical protein
MQNFPIAEWYVSDNVCGLCDSERHLAHVVKVRSQWHAFDATHPNEQRTGCLFLGSFARKLTAMEAAESETLKLETRVSFNSVSPDSERIRHLPSAA